MKLLIIRAMLAKADVLLLDEVRLTRNVCMYLCIDLCTMYV